ncbi:MAG TPA: DUF308 domain-containing protein, partial [Candidatus Pygmaiobacter gallistercoris]|nr:DUF308 domain-containing protein [Candidatus Pygmaiobacter gallistercoris]
VSFLVGAFRGKAWSYMMKKIKLPDEFSTLALAGILLGLVLLIWPSLSGRLICYAIAAVLAVYGVYRIVCYFTRDIVLTMLRRDLAAGLAALVGALFLILRPELLISLLPVLFGLALLVGAISELQAAFDLRRMEDDRWYYPLIAAAVQGVLGAVILANPFGTAMVLMRFIGASLVVEGICELVFSLLVRRRRASYFPSHEE